jgi:hypothetical protein
MARDNEARFMKHDRVLQAGKTRKPLRLGRFHSIHDLSETLGAVGVSKKEMSRIRAMGLAIHALCHPALLIQDRSNLVSQAPTDTTDGQQGFFSHRRGGSLMNDLSEQGFTSHLLPPTV